MLKVRHYAEYYFYIAFKSFQNNKKKIKNALSFFKRERANMQVVSPGWRILVLTNTATSLDHFLSRQ